MIKEIDELKRQYRRIEAPPSVLTRVRVEVAKRPIQSLSWMPLTATLVVVVTAAWLLPVILQQKAPDPVMPSTPSLSALAQLKPAKPAVSTPDLSALRSVSTPRMPAKPVVTPAPKPQTRQNTQDDELKENQHA